MYRYKRLERREDNKGAGEEEDYTGVSRIHRVSVCLTFA